MEALEKINEGVQNGEGLGVQSQPNATTTSLPNTTPEISLSPEDIAYLKDREIDPLLAWNSGFRSGKADKHKDQDRFNLGAQYGKHGLGRILTSHLVVNYQECLDQKARVRLRPHRQVVTIPAVEEGGNLVEDEQIYTYPKWLATAAPAVPFLPPYIFRPWAESKTRLDEDTNVPIYYVEAPAKALCLASHGMAAVGLAGVEAGFLDPRKSIKGVKGIPEANAELGRIEQRGRQDIICYDAGINNNPAVARGAARLAELLRLQGADVCMILLPLHFEADVRREAVELGLPADVIETEIIGLRLGCEPGAPESYAGYVKHNGDQGPDDFIARYHRYAKALGRNDANAFATAAFHRLPKVPADAVQWARTVRDGASSKETRSAALHDLLERLPYQAMLSVGGEAAIDGTYAIVKGADIGKKSLREAASKYEARSKAKLEAALPDWKEDLQTTRSGAYMGSLLNARLVLQHDPALSGILRFNEFTSEVTVKGKVPWLDPEISSRTIQDVDGIEIRTYLQRQGVHAAKDDVWDAVTAEAQRASYHPVRDYLLNLKWDGIKRLDLWLTTYLGAENTEYTRLAGAWWLQQAADRVLDPGCQADYTLVLEGLQGGQKTSVCRAIAVNNEWFCGSKLDISNKDAYGLLAGVWIYELGEGAILRRFDARDMKHFLTEMFDKWRLPYGRMFIRKPRQVSFIMTTNDTEYLIDTTGNRRYHPILCTEINLDGLKEDMGQLWAEAVERVKAKARRWPTEEEEVRLFRPEQEDRRKPAKWEHAARKAVEGKNIVTTDYLLREIGLKDANLRDDHARDAASALLAIGWTLVRRRIEGNGRPRVYVRPGATVSDDDILKAVTTVEVDLTDILENM
jgi:predicted P-loop ATPase